MLEDNNNKDYKGFSFIQEQIVSKKKCRLKKMLFSVIWTIFLACIFGVVACVAFFVSEPTISKMLGKGEEKKTVEFPTISPDERELVEGNVLPGNNIGNDKNQVVNNAQNQIDETDANQNEETETIIIEKYVNGNLKDLTSIYTEIRTLSNQVNRSLLSVECINKEIDGFNNEYEKTKTTTGLVVADNGAELLILTSYDKIKDTKDIHVTLVDQTRLSARLQSYDNELNLAIIAVKLELLSDNQLSYIKVANLGESYLASVGMPILALGAPNGNVGSMEFGMISGKATSVYITDNKVDIFHTDITNNEDSEGIIVNLNGEVIGIITQSIKDEDSQNISTALGISKIKKIIEGLVNNKEQVYFGIKAEDLTDVALKQLELDHGIYVTEVKPNSPALDGGLQSGDVILEIDDNSVLSVQSFQNMITTYEAKQSIKVLVRRTTNSSTKDVELDVVLGKKND